MYEVLCSLNHHKWLVEIDALHGAADKLFDEI